MLLVNSKYPIITSHNHISSRKFVFNKISINLFFILETKLNLGIIRKSLNIACMSIGKELANVCFKHGRYIK